MSLDLIKLEVGRKQGKVLENFAELWIVNSPKVFATPNPLAKQIKVSNSNFTLEEFFRM